MRHDARDSDEETEAAGRRIATHMCTLLIACMPGSPEPLVIAGNRDEAFDRPSDPPGVIVPDPWIFGGRDRVAGGSWLAVGAAGLVAAVANAGPGAPDPRLRSREALVVELARSASLDDARQRLADVRTADYNPFNLVVAGPRGGFILRSEDAAIFHLRPGITPVVNEPFGAESGAKHRRLAEAAQRLHAADLREPWRLLADHGPPGDPNAALCVHGEHRGTVSASAIILTEAGRVASFRFTAGPPCSFPPLDASLPSHTHH